VTAIRVPIFTLVVRETQRVASPTIDGIRGPVLPLFTAESLADEACRIEPGLDPKRINSYAVLLQLLTDAKAEGCRVVVIDAENRLGLLMAITKAIEMVEASIYT